jgi:hypothetical protein
MMSTGVYFESSQLGTRAVISSTWSPEVHDQILARKPEELEINEGKGWRGENIEFVKYYNWLKSIIIMDFKIKDVSFVNSLINLEKLNVSTYCKTEIQFFNFPQLQSCSLEWRPNAKSVFDCVTLKDLFINRYKGKSSQTFEKLVNLEVLGILNSPMTEVLHFKKLQKLRSLRLGNLRLLQSLDGIETLSELRRLLVQTCRAIHSISPLSQLKNLEEVFLLNGGKIETLKPLIGLPNLRTVVFYESTNIVDGDLTFLHSNERITSVAFQNRKHYSQKMQDFGERSK